MILVVGGSADVEQLKLLLSSASRTSTATNLLFALTDRTALAALSDDAPLVSTGEEQRAGGPRSVSWTLEEEAGGASAIASLRYKLIGLLLGWGFGVLNAAPPTVFLSSPWSYLYRDADIEAMSSGWDDGSAYGYNHVLDDPSMGFTRFCHGSRIVAYEPGFFFAMPTNEAIALTARMGLSMAQLPAAATVKAVREAEREAFLHELWLPSHHEYASVGAILRVMNYLCFVNSKVMFRQLRSATFATAPIAVQINYHSTDAPARMSAVMERYLDLKPSTLQQLPLAEAQAGGGANAMATTDEPTLSCDRSGASSGSSLGPMLAASLVERSPYAWGGMGDLIFSQDGTLKTPWGTGSWGLHSPSALWADFVGAKHNVRMLPSGLGISTRCGDNNVVLVRSIKVAKQQH
uniref:Nucleotide-diphospho-sugar transferase domain-containing protein n=1 Tax=Haptolina brevifila TaxID=156173 RepID=A0A7S2NNV6_9EUKA